MSRPEFQPATALHRGLLCWEWTNPVTVLSSAPVGGGIAEPDWLLNIGVPSDFARTDLDAYVAEVVAAQGIAGDGVALLTAAHIERAQSVVHEGVSAHVTVGISKPTWAADPSGGYTSWSPGTINIVVQLPVGLTPAAAVNAVITATEAKTQALGEAEVPGTGTASDAVVIVWPSNHVESAQFGGPRSLWGSRIAQAVHAAVGSGIGQ